MESGKTVFITGADRGIGLALCKEFLEHGWQVIAGRYMDQWAELDELKKEYSSLETVPLNVADPDSVKLAADRTGELLDHLDMLVHVAGIFSKDRDPKVIHALMKINALGPVCVTHAFLPLMQEGEKRLCFVSSEAGSISLAHRHHEYGYGASKAALNMAVKMMFNTLRGKGFRFRLYHPGWVNSFMETKEKSTVAPYEPEDTARVAYRAFTEDRRHEDVLVMTDIEDRTWSF